MDTREDQADRQLDALRVDGPQRLQPILAGNLYKFKFKDMGNGLLSIKRLDGYWPEVIFLERESALALAEYIGRMNPEAI